MAQDQKPVAAAPEAKEAQASGFEQKMQKNSRAVVGTIIAVVAVVAIGLGVWYLWLLPNKEKAIQEGNDAIGLADNMLTVNPDSALVMYKEIAEKYDYDAGNRAALNAAIILYKNGEYQEAIEYCKKYDGKDVVVAAAAKAFQGDCNVNLDNFDEAISLYKEAEKIAGDNPYYTPYFIIKLARVYGAKGDYAAEKEAYESLQKNYPSYNTAMVAAALEKATVNAANPNAAAPEVPVLQKTVVAAPAETPATVEE